MVWNHRNPESAWWPHWEIGNHDDANFVVTRDTTGCHNDNLWCHQWRQSWHHDHSCIFKGLCCIWASRSFITKSVIFNDFIENLAHDMTSSHMRYPVHILSQSSLWPHKIITARRVWYRVETVTATNKGISVSVILNMWHWPYERNNPYLKFDFFYIWYLCHMISK